MGTENLRKFFADDRIHVIAGRVEIPPGESSHFSVNEENNVVLHVITHHHGVRIQANLSNGPGVWTIPDIGTEVMLASDNGDFEGEMYVIGTYHSTNHPNASIPASIGSQVFNVAVTGDANIVVGPGGKIRLISDTLIEAASASGAGVSLAKQSELHDIWVYLTKQFNPAAGHQHKGIVPALPTVMAEGVTAGTTALLPDIEPSGTDLLKGE